MSLFRVQLDARWEDKDAGCIPSGMTVSRPKLALLWKTARLRRDMTEIMEKKLPADIEWAPRPVTNGYRTDRGHLAFHAAHAKDTDGIVIVGDEKCGTMKRR